MSSDLLKQFDLPKYIYKNLENYNRIVVYFELSSQTDINNIAINERIINILLQVKTLFNVTDTLTITTNKSYVNIAENTIKIFAKQNYIKQNRLYTLHTLQQNKSNLFGWSEQDDADILDKCISQTNIEKYIHNIVDLYNISNIQISKEKVDNIAEFSNLCKDTYITESYIEYNLKLDTITHFIIREYIPLGKINIMLICEFNEEKKILTEKLDRLGNYIKDIHFIVNC